MPESLQFQLEEPGIPQRTVPGILPVEEAGVTATGRPDPRRRILAEHAGVLVGGHRCIDDELRVRAEGGKGHTIEEDAHIPF